MINHKSQNGSTLIVVLLLLLIITILGTIAIRQGLTSLNIATNSQARNLLVQSSDTVFFRTEDPAQLPSNMLAQGMFGFIKTDANRGKELVFCFRPQVNTAFFDLSKASLISWTSGTSPSNGEISTDGYCDAGSSTDYTSSRKAAITQVSVKQADLSSTPFQFMQRGTDSDAAKIQDLQRIVVTSTSVIPGLSSASTSDINACFSNHLSDPVVPSGVTAATNADDSVTDCMARNNVPYNTQVTEYNLMQLVSRCQVSGTAQAGTPSC